MSPFQAICLDHNKLKRLLFTSVQRYVMLIEVYSVFQAIMQVDWILTLGIPWKAKYYYYFLRV